MDRRLGLAAATSAVVGQVIAVGIFLTPGTIIRTLASPLWVLVVWLLIGGMALCGALCYGALQTGQRIDQIVGIRCMRFSH